MILGLDASTSVVGWCMLRDDGTVIEAGHVSFNKDDDLYERLHQLRKALKRVIILARWKHQDKLTHVFIEEPKKMFGGGSSAHVMSLLQRWNGMVSAMISFDFCNPILLNEKSARADVGITVPKECKNAKLLVAEFVKASAALPESIWEYKRTGNLKDHCLDISDAYVIATAGYLSVASELS